MVDTLNKNENYYDAYDLLMNSFRVHEKVKHLLKQNLFLEQNPDIVTNLARLLFLVDEINLEDDEIVARKSITTEEKVEEPNIPIDSIIYQYLIKIKYDTLSNTDITKLNELKQYPSYIKLYNLLNLAIEQRVKIQKIDEVDKLKMSLNELEVFLVI